jgi:MFS family permease
MLFVTVPMAILSPVSGRLYEIIGPRWLQFCGFVFLIISIVTQLFFTGAASFCIVAVGTFSFGLGLGFIWGPSTTASLSTFSQDNAGIASGSFCTIQEIGGVVGLAITVTVVRMHTNFITGYHEGMWVLLLICGIGLIGSLFMNRKQ